MYRIRACVIVPLLLHLTDLLLSPATLTKLAAFNRKILQTEKQSIVFQITLHFFLSLLHNFPISLHHALLLFSIFFDCFLVLAICFSPSFLKSRLCGLRISFSFMLSYYLLPTVLGGALNWVFQNYLVYSECLSPPLFKLPDPVLLAQVIFFKVW